MNTISMLPERNSVMSSLCAIIRTVSGLPNVQVNRRLKLWKAPLGRKYGKNTIFNWSDSERDGQKKSPLPEVSNTFFAYPQHGKPCFFPLKKIISKEVMFPAHPREKPCWIKLNGKIIPQDTGENSLAQGIRNGAGHLSPLGSWFSSGSEWESKSH